MAAVGTQSAGVKAGLQTKDLCNAKSEPEEDDTLECPRDSARDCGPCAMRFIWSGIIIMIVTPQ
jgi:hypothetical protein